MSRLVQVTQGWDLLVVQLLHARNQSCSPQTAVSHNRGRTRSSDTCPGWVGGWGLDQKSHCAWNSLLFPLPIWCWLGRRGLWHFPGAPCCLLAPRKRAVRGRRAPLELGLLCPLAASCSFLHVHLLLVSAGSHQSSPDPRETISSALSQEDVEMGVVKCDLLSAKTSCTLEQTSAGSAHAPARFSQEPFAGKRVEGHPDPL